MNLEQFVYRKVAVRFRNGFTATGTLLRSHYSSDYPYIFEKNFYTRRGEILIDKLSKYDIVSIEPVKYAILSEEPQMTEPNYKELAEEFYNAFRQIYGILSPEQKAILEKYKKLHKPKMTFVGYSNVEKFVYKDKDYALIDGYWYHCQKGILVFREDGDFADELSKAQLEYMKSKPV